MDFTPGLRGGMIRQEGRILLVCPRGSLPETSPVCGFSAAYNDNVPCGNIRTRASRAAAQAIRATAINRSRLHRTLSSHGKNNSGHFGRISATSRSDRGQPSPQTADR